MNHFVTSRRIRQWKAPFWSAVLMTFGSLPILAPIWAFNGVLSVEGLPQMWSLLLGDAPSTISHLFTKIGWFTVVASTVIEIRVIWCLINNVEITTPIWGASIFFSVYDLGTTGLGLLSRFSPTSVVGWVIWFLAVVITTYLVETVLSTIWRTV